MPSARLQTEHLELVSKTREQMIAEIAAMPPETRAHVSDDWLAKLHASAAEDFWVHGFAILLRESGAEVGSCGFKGPPGAEGMVEIAYGVDERQRGKGFATEAAAALAEFAYSHPEVRRVIAHTLPEPNASTRVLTKCGFAFIGEVIDPEDGRVWRWERRGDRSC
jgi:RimJ/RimL family protein N-acetyltransferase